jgi:hypothetical protein
MKRTIFLLLITTILITCQKSPDTNPNITFRYIEDLCCGNLMIMNGETIESPTGNWVDSLTYGVNLDEYISSQNLDFGDELFIEFEVLPLPLAEDIQVDCEVICNRHSGILIQINSLEKL